MIDMLEMFENQICKIPCVIVNDDLDESNVYVTFNEYDVFNWYYIQWIEILFI